MRQHEYVPGGTFHFAESIGQIIYRYHDDQGRRVTVFVAEVHSNALDFARALVSPAPDPSDPLDTEGLLTGKDGAA